jgi:hypothetical protein
LLARFIASFPIMHRSAAGSAIPKQHGDAMSPRLLFLLVLLPLAACDYVDRDQSVKIVRAIDAKVAELGRSGQDSITFTYQPGSTMGWGDRPIGDYDVTLTDKGGRREVRISERGGQVHGTYQFPKVVFATDRMAVTKRQGEALTFTLTRAGAAVELTSMR